MFAFKNFINTNETPIQTKKFARTTLKTSRSNKSLIFTPPNKSYFMFAKGVPLIPFIKMK